MWTQVVGKIRLVQTPLLNHWWNVTLYVTARGLTTSPMPYDVRIFQIDFDFIDHHLLTRSSDGLPSPGFSHKASTLCPFLGRSAGPISKKIWRHSM
jgi:hypothetical protein